MLTLNIKKVAAIAGIVLAATAGIAWAQDGAPEGAADHVSIAELSADHAGSPREGAVSDGETYFAEGAQVVQIPLASGGSVYFVEVVPGLAGMMEWVPPGAAAIASIPELRRAAIDEVFYALSEPGAPVPEYIELAGSAARLMGDAPITYAADVETRPQGWARAVLSGAGLSAQINPHGEVQLPDSGPCNDDWMRTRVENTNYNDRDTPKSRFNQRPGTSGNFVTHYEPGPPGSGYNMKFYRYSVGGHMGSWWPDVDRYYTIVAVCAIDTYEPYNPGDKAHPSYQDDYYSNPHMGPYVKFRARWPGGDYTTVSGHDFAASEVGGYWYWHWISTNVDWVTEVFWCGADDEFDIAHAVEDD